MSDVLKSSYLAESAFWTESKIYFVTVWLEVLLSPLILLTFSSRSCCS